VSGAQGGPGETPPEKNLCLRKCDTYLGKRLMYLDGFFGTWFFVDGFLFLVKKLGFWTNPGHWVRVLDAAGSYMYIVL
jgi:hypothetical protein